MNDSLCLLSRGASGLHERLSSAAMKCWQRRPLPRTTLLWAY
ncbi:MAG: hypothetical protein WAX69_11330 [Victivallales bacterium]